MADAAQISLEANLPQFVAERWSVQQYARHSGVHHTTAARYLATKREELRTVSTQKLGGIGDGYWTTLSERAELDRAMLEGLNGDQRAGKPVSDKLVGSLVRRIVALMSLRESFEAKRGADDSRNRQGCIAFPSSV